VERDYWPTAGWRTADPKAQGVDPAAIAKVDEESQCVTTTNSG
jgi:hypothetical protein